MIDEHRHDRPDRPPFPRHPRPDRDSRCRDAGDESADGQYLRRPADRADAQPVSRSQAHCGDHGGRVDVHRQRPRSVGGGIGKHPERGGYRAGAGIRSLCRRMGRYGRENGHHRADHPRPLNPPRRRPRRRRSASARRYRPYDQGDPRRAGRYRHRCPE